VIGAAWRSDKDRGKSRRLGAEDQGWSSIGRVLSGRMIKRSGDAVCGLQRAQGEKEHGFLLGLASKPRSFGLKTFCGFSSLGLKIGSYGLVIRVSKSLRQSPALGIKTKWEEVCRFVPQN
jgi:hypothetical protein